MNKNYLCSRCLKSFDRKSNFVRHINRINPCSKIINSNTDEEEQRNNLKKYLHKNFPKLSENIVADIVGENIIKEDKKYVCDFCNKSFQSSTYFKKHKRELCSRHLRFEQHIIKDYLKKIEKIKQENMTLKEKIYLKNKTLPRYCVEEGKVINVEKSYLHFYEQKNIRPFGNEILDHVTDKFMKKMIMNPEIGLTNLVRIIHFNPEIPQNRNLFVKSQKFITVEVYKKSGWKTISRRDIFQNIIATKKDIMDEYYDKFYENKELKPKYISKYEQFSDALDKYINHIVFATDYDNRLKKARTIYEKISKMINLLFLNNQKIEITYTPEQNIKTSIEDIKYSFNVKKPPPEIENESEENDSYELYCEENTNKINNNNNEVNDLIDKTEKELKQLIIENNLDKYNNFLSEFNDNDKGMNLDESEMYSDDDEIIIKKL